jgi:hypothetical protein
MTSSWHICAFLSEALYPASCRIWSSSTVLVLHASGVGAARRMSSTYWRMVQAFGQLFSRFQAKASPKIVGEFLRSYGSLVQVNCPFIPVSGSSHSNANSGWMASTSCRQKKVSLRPRHVNTLVVGGIKLSKVYGLGTTG